MTTFKQAKTQKDTDGYTPDGTEPIPFTGTGDEDYAATFAEHSSGAGYPGLDANGNLVSSVALRTGTVSELLAVGDAGDGEIAVATDEDVIYVYRGSPTATPIAYRRGLNQFDDFVRSTNFVMVPQNTWTRLTGAEPRVQASLDDNTTLLMYDAYIESNQTPGSGATQVSFRLEVETAPDSDVWDNLVGTIAIPVHDNIPTLGVLWNVEVDPAKAVVGSRIRLAMLHDGTSDMGQICRFKLVGYHPKSI